MGNEIIKRHFTYESFVGEIEKLRPVNRPDVAIKSFETSKPMFNGTIDRIGTFVVLSTIVQNYLLVYKFNGGEIDYYGPRVPSNGKLTLNDLRESTLRVQDKIAQHLEGLGYRISRESAYGLFDLLELQAGSCPTEEELEAVENVR